MGCVVQFGVTICMPAPIVPIGTGQVMFPAGDVVGSERAGFDPLPPMPGIPGPVFPLSPEGEVMGGIVPAPVEPAGGIVCIPLLGLGVFMPGMATVEELVPEPPVPMPDIVEELAPALVVPMSSMVVLDDLARSRCHCLSSWTVSSIGWHVPSPCPSHPSQTCHGPDRRPTATESAAPTVAVAATAPMINAVEAPRELSTSRLRRAGSVKAVCPARTKRKNPDSSINDTVIPTGSVVSPTLGEVEGVAGHCAPEHGRRHELPVGPGGDGPQRCAHESQCVDDEEHGQPRASPQSVGTMAA